MHKFNTKRRFGESQCYVHVKIDGRDALFTEDQIKVAYERASREPEDVPKSPRPWWKLWA